MLRSRFRRFPLLTHRSYPTLLLAVASFSTTSPALQGKMPAYPGMKDGASNLASRPGQVPAGIPGMMNTPGYQQTMDPTQQGQVPERQRKADRIEKTNARYTVERVDEDEAKEMNESGYFVGIDLGTTNSCLSYIDPVTKKPKVIPSPTGSWVFPTAVTFDKNHTIRVFGEEARSSARSSASATLCSGKRLIGRRYGELERVTSQMSKTNFLAFNEKGEVSVEVGGKTYSIVHVTAMFLRYLKHCAEEFLNHPVNSCVVSVPAYFTPQQKVATEDATLIAGFDVLEVIDEPTAACLSYSVLHADEDQPMKPVQTNLVVDLGGGTLDCALMDHDTVRHTFNLIATHGDPLLGGNDWDNTIAKILSERFKQKWKIDIDNPMGKSMAANTSDQRILLLEAEKAKIHFSNSMEDYHGFVRSFHFSEAACEVIPLEASFTLQEYMDITKPLRTRCIACLERLFEEAKRDPKKVDNILLVGAMTRDPPIRIMLEDYFGKPPVASEECAADYAVAIGAAVRGGMLLGAFPKLMKNTSFLLGTSQALRSGTWSSRTMNSVRQLFTPKSVNPNAIGQKWRGKVGGLSNEQIEGYAKELVEFEATSSRRLLLDKIETDSNNILQRVSRYSSVRHGSQDRRITILVEQIKFWQYLVHNFHDHEQHLQQAVEELEEHLDDLEARPEKEEEEGPMGYKTPRYAKDEEEGGSRRDKSKSYVGGDGTVHFDNVESKENGAEEKIIKAESEGTPNDDGDEEGKGKIPEGIDFNKKTKAEFTPPIPRKKAKVMRREVPVPQSATVERIVERGQLNLTEDRFTEDSFDIGEKQRQSFFKEYVEDRAYRDVPAPPGESGSWKEVKEAMEKGSPVGGVLPWEEDPRVRPMSIEEQIDRLQEEFPLGPKQTEDQLLVYQENTLLGSMTVAGCLAPQFSATKQNNKAKE